VCAAAALPMGGRDALMALHPGRLVWAYREPAAEASALAAVRRWHEAQQEAGVRLEQLQQQVAARGGGQVGGGCCCWRCCCWRCCCGDRPLLLASTWQPPSPAQLATRRLPASLPQEPWHQGGAPHDPGAELERWEAAAATAAATAAAGHSNGWFTHRDLLSMPGLELAAGCSTGGLFQRLLPGRLGLHSRSLKAAASEGAAGAGAGGPGPGRRLPYHALGFSVGGGVVQLSAVSQGLGGGLLAASERAELAQAVLGSERWPGQAAEQDPDGSMDCQPSPLVSAMAEELAVPGGPGSQELARRLAAALGAGLLRPGASSAQPAVLAALRERCSPHHVGWVCRLPGPYRGEDGAAQGEGEEGSGDEEEGAGHACLPMVDLDWLAECLGGQGGIPGAPGAELRQCKAALQGLAEEEGPC
jgi:hypothetical protein